MRVRGRECGFDHFRRDIGSQSLLTEIQDRIVSFLDGRVFERPKDLFTITSINPRGLHKLAVIRIQ
jgi:hypothetical protein